MGCATPRRATTYRGEGYQICKPELQDDNGPQGRIFRPCTDKGHDFSEHIRILKYFGISKVPFLDDALASPASRRLEYGLLAPAMDDAGLPG